MHKDLLINVTAFFRDAEAFEELRRTGHRAADPGRTASEEPVRVVGGRVLLRRGGLFHRHAADGGESRPPARHLPSQVFATDIDEEALEFARQGVYPESIVADVGAARLAGSSSGKSRATRSANRSAIAWSSPRIT